MNLSIYSFLNKVPRGPYGLSNMHLICVSTCRHNNIQQHIFEGQVFRMSSSGYVSISNLHGIHYYTITFNFLSKSCIMWYVVYHTLVFNEFLPFSFHWKNAVCYPFVAWSCLLHLNTSSTFEVLKWVANQHQAQNQDLGQLAPTSMKQDNKLCSRCNCLKLKYYLLWHYNIDNYEIITLL